MKMSFKTSFSTQMDALSVVGYHLSTKMIVGVATASILLAVVTYLIFYVYKDKNVSWKYTIPIYISWYAFWIRFSLGFLVLQE